MRAEHTDCSMRQNKTRAGKWLRALLTIVGTVFVSLGIVGIFIPILPTTPFLLLAAACYAKSSQRFYHWLLSNRWFGAYIGNYRQKRGDAAKDKDSDCGIVMVDHRGFGCIRSPVFNG